MKLDLRKLVASEALAYLRSGFLIGGRSAIIERRSRTPKLGIYFVPGFAASAAQLLPLKDALSEEAEWFDAFDYRADRPLKVLADEMMDALEQAAASCPKVLIVGHSLGGLLARIALQSVRPPKQVAGLVSICAPLHGTLRSKLAPVPELRSLAPDGPLIDELSGTKHRLAPYKGAILTVGARYDSFIAPHESAFIDGEERLCLDDVSHVGSLFDERVHRAVVALARRIKSGGPQKDAER